MNNTNAFDTLMEIVKNSDELNMEYDCSYTPNMENANKNHHIWKIKVYGKGTFENKELIKKSSFKWDKDNKLWLKYLNDDDVPKKYIDIQKNKEKIYYNSIGLTYPDCSPKCNNELCNNHISFNSDFNLCYSCDYKKICNGKYKCKGWMSNKCKYNDFNSTGKIMCKGCENDSYIWSQEGKKFNKGGWFANDRS